MPISPLRVGKRGVELPFANSVEQKGNSRRDFHSLVSFLYLYQVLCTVHPRMPKIHRHRPSSNVSLVPPEILDHRTVNDPNGQNNGKVNLITCNKNMEFHRIMQTTVINFTKLVRKSKR